MEKVICIISCTSVIAGHKVVNEGDILWTPYDEIDLSTVKWISLYRSDFKSSETYLGAYLGCNFCELGSWREFRMGQVLD